MLKSRIFIMLLHNYHNSSSFLSVDTYTFFCWNIVGESDEIWHRFQLRVCVLLYYDKFMPIDEWWFSGFVRGFRQWRFRRSISPSATVTLFCRTDCSLLFECFVPSWSVTFRLARLCVIQSNSVQFYIILSVCQFVGIFLHPVISCPVRSCSSYALTHPFLRHIVWFLFISIHSSRFISWLSFHSFNDVSQICTFNIVFNEMLVLYVAITFINTFHWFPIDLNCLSMISKDFHGGTTKHMGCNLFHVFAMV